MMKNWKLVDAKGLILGRVATQITKMMLLGDNVVIINCIDACISGNRANILNHYQAYKNVRTRSNPKRGPWRVGTRPDVFVKKVIRPMLPKNERGTLALHRLHCYIHDIPELKKAQYGEPQKVEFSEKFKINHLSRKPVSVGDICDIVGWNHGGMK